MVGAHYFDDPPGTSLPEHQRLDIERIWPLMNKLEIEVGPEPMEMWGLPASRAVFHYDFEADARLVAHVRTDCRFVRRGATVFRFFAADGPGPKEATPAEFASFFRSVRIDPEPRSI